MGFFSSTVSFVRYRVEGRIPGDLTEAVREGLKRDAIRDIESDPAESASGWTSFGSPFHPDFEGDSFLMGNHFVFSLRIDRKPLASSLLQKELILSSRRRLRETRRSFLSRDEKQALREKVTATLLARIPPVPHVYDLVWDPEQARVLFFSVQKNANEELERLFRRSFSLSLIRIIPYTAAELQCGLSNKEKDLLAALTPSRL
ncbi:MAG: recombination-associated protein RdgC [Desulfobacterales bacterium]